MSETATVWVNGNAFMVLKVRHAAELTMKLREQGKKAWVTF